MGQGSITIVVFADHRIPRQHIIPRGVHQLTTTPRTSKRSSSTSSRTVRLCVHLVGNDDHVCISPGQKPLCFCFYVIVGMPACCCTSQLPQQLAACWLCDTCMIHPHESSVGDWLAVVKTCMLSPHESLVGDCLAVETCAARYFVHCGKVT